MQQGSSAKLLEQRHHWKEDACHGNGRGFEMQAGTQVPGKVSLGQCGMQGEGEQLREVHAGSSGPHRMG